MSDAIESTAVEEPVPEPTRALAVVPTPAYAVTPNVEAAELVQRLNVIREASETAMKDGVDYGRIPGVDKPTLLKPGAEKLGVLFQLDIQLDNEKTWGPGDHLTVDSKATVYHAPTGVRLGFGEGMCSTRERKYGKRKQERVCPACGVAAIIKGKIEYGGGWVCFKKKNGCGAKFRDEDPVITGQAVGEVENPDLPDTWNTVVKMAEKRARVDAVLAVTGASALFTQDAEDLGQPPAPEPPAAPPAPARDDIAEVKALGRRNKLRTTEWRNLLRAAGLEVGEKDNPIPLVESLTPEQAEAMLSVLRGPIPTGESDIPANTDDFKPEPPAEGDVPWEGEKPAPEVPS
jgi:hypothetical protein